MDIVDSLQEIGNNIFLNVKDLLKVDYNIILDDDAESDWNEFWDDFVLSRVPDDEWDDENV